MTDYDKVLQMLKELRPAAVAMKHVKEHPPEWWIDKVIEEVNRLKEKENT